MRNKTLTLNCTVRGDVAYLPILGGVGTMNSSGIHKVEASRYGNDGSDGGGSGR